MSCHCPVCVRLSHSIKDYLLTYLLIYTVLITTVTTTFENVSDAALMAVGRGKNLHSSIISIFYIIMKSVYIWQTQSKKCCHVFWDTVYKTRWLVTVGRLCCGLTALGARTVTAGLNCSPPPSLKADCCNPLLIRACVWQRGRDGDYSVPWSEKSWFWWYHGSSSCLSIKLRQKWLIRLGGVVVRTSDWRLSSGDCRIPVMTLIGYFWDRWPSLAGKLSWDVTTT